MKTGVIVKFSQNVLIGVAAFVLSVWWAFRSQRLSIFPVTRTNFCIGGIWLESNICREGYLCQRVKQCAAMRQHVPATSSLTISDEVEKLISYP